MFSGIVKAKKLMYTIDPCGEMIFSRLSKVKVQFQPQRITTGAGRDTAGRVFTTATELNIWLNILDAGAHAVPGCNLACLCAQRDGEL